MNRPIFTFVFSISMETRVLDVLGRRSRDASRTVKSDAESRAAIRLGGRPKKEGHRTYASERVLHAGCDACVPRASESIFGG